MPSGFGASGIRNGSTGLFASHEATAIFSASEIVAAIDINPTCKFARIASGGNLARTSRLGINPVLSVS
jgi:hypothetical protein